MSSKAVELKLQPKDGYDGDPEQLAQAVLDRVEESDTPSENCWIDREDVLAQRVPKDEMTGAPAHIRAKAHFRNLPDEEAITLAENIIYPYVKWCRMRAHMPCYHDEATGKNCGDWYVVDSHGTVPEGV